MAQPLPNAAPRTATPALPGGALCVSLDFELYWGVRDKLPLEAYRENLAGVRPAIDGMLQVFVSAGIHATWAAVGLLFFRDSKEALAGLPPRLPSYADARLSPYRHLADAADADGALHFAPEVIERIARSPGQEIATHTFSHYYCLEKGQSAEEFRQDLAAAIRLARERGLAIASMVFPRNQWNPAYLPILQELGVRCFRGNERSWAHAASEDAAQGALRRAVRLLDAYLDVTGHHTYPLEACGGAVPYDLPASRFLRPWSRRLAALEGLRFRRIAQSMEHAARQGEVFHLWWHPHNFGTGTAQNLAFLMRVADHFQVLRQRYGMQALNMGELAARLDARAST